jgi:hypothetical protein
VFPVQILPVTPVSLSDQQLLYIMSSAMNTGPTPVIDPGERDELDDVFHRPVNETEADPTVDTPEFPDLDPEFEQPDVPGPGSPAPPGPEQPEPPGPQLPVQPEVPKPPPRPDLPGPPERPDKPEPPKPPVRPDPPEQPKPPVQPGPPDHPKPPGRPDRPGPHQEPEGPREPEQPQPPVRPDQPGPPRQPERPGPPRDPERPRQPEGPCQPEAPPPPEDPRPPFRPDEPGPPVQPEQPHVCVDCLPTSCVLSDTVVLTCCAGAVAALAACLAVAGLYVVLRYLGQYIFYAALTLLILAIVYLHLRRPEDARRLRRFLAERGREALGRLWGWAIQRTEVITFGFQLGQLLKFALSLNTIYTLFCFLT